MAKRSFRIEFIRKVTEHERNFNNLMWYDEEGGLIFDMTEFDSEYQTNEVLFVDLINLFNDFCDENAFEDVTVTDLMEVAYDGDGTAWYAGRIADKEGMNMKQMRSEQPYNLTDERYQQMRSLYDDERIAEIIDEWGVDLVNKGYDIFSFNGWDLYEVSRIDDVMAFDSDDDAVEQAIKDGVKIIPVEELPETFGRRYLGWIDTPENRAKIAELAEKYPNDSLVC